MMNDVISQVRIGGHLYDIGDVGQSVIAPEYDETSAQYPLHYFPPDCVMYDGALYRCIAPTVSGLFNSECWEEIHVSAELNNTNFATIGALLAIYNHELYFPGSLVWDEDPEPGRFKTVKMPIPPGGCVVVLTQNVQMDAGGCPIVDYPRFRENGINVLLIPVSHEGYFYLYFDGADTTKDTINSNIHILCVESNKSSLKRNNPDAVREFLDVAEQYYKKTIPYYVMESVGDTASMYYCDYDIPGWGGNPQVIADNAAFVINSLAGIEGDFYSNTLLPSGAHTKNEKYPWADNAKKRKDALGYWDSLTGQMMYPITMPYQLAEWMFNHGQCVMQFNPEVDIILPTTNSSTYEGYMEDSEFLNRRGLSLEDIQPGDLVFFAETEPSINGPVYVQKDGFMNIDHVAIVCDVDSICLDATQSSVRTIWNHTILEFISPSNAFAHGGVRSETRIEGIEAPFMNKRPLWVDPVDSEGLEYDGTVACGWNMVMVCRPDLHTPSINSLANEARKLGMHSVPKNWGIMNAIKRARQFTDVKWTPAVDKERFSLEYVDPETDEPVLYEGAKFRAGVEYTGIPCAGIDVVPLERRIGMGTMGIEAFASTVGIEGSAAASTNCGWSMAELNDPKSVFNNVFYDGSTSRVNYPVLGDYIVNDVEFYSGIVSDIIYKEDGRTPEMCEVSGFFLGGCPNANDKDGPVGGIARRQWFQVYHNEVVTHYQ